MDFYTYLTNKGVIPYRLMSGIRNLVDFEHNYNQETYSPIKKEHHQNEDDRYFAKKLFNTSRIVEGWNSGRISEENVLLNKVDRQALRFIHEIKLLYNENQALQNKILRLEAKLNKKSINIPKTDEDKKIEREVKKIIDSAQTVKENGGF